MKIWAVMRRDLRKFVRNPLTMAASILMPIVYLVIMGNSFHGELKNLPVVVVSQDNGPYARRLIARMQALAAGPKTITLSYMPNAGAAIEAVRQGKYKGAVVIPADFSRAMAHDNVGEVGLFTDNVDVISAATLEGLFNSAVDSLRGEFVTARPLKLHGLVMRESPLYPQLDYDRSLIPGVIVMALFMGSLTSGVFNWVMDKFMGVTECYLVTPLRRFDIAGGMLASSVVMTSLGGIAVLFVALLVTGSTITGGLPTLVALTGIIVLVATGLLAMMFSLLGRAGHPRLVGVFAGFLNVVLFFPSGAIYPVESFPPWLRAFARYNPETHAVNALKSILFKGVALSAVAGDLLFLAVFMAVMLVVASLSFKRTL